MPTSRHRPAVDWFEVISENFLDSGGRPRIVLEQIAERYPVVMHGVSLSIGSTDPLDFDYLGKLKRLARRSSPGWISDHSAGRASRAARPRPAAAAAHRSVAARTSIERVRTVQDFLERPLVLENPSTYVAFTAYDDARMGVPRPPRDGRPTAACCSTSTTSTSASRNHDFDPDEYLRSMPHDRVVQFHLAGHTDLGTHCIDTHDGRVVDEVWELYAQVHRVTGGRATLLEWDARIPSFRTCRRNCGRRRTFVISAHASAHRHERGTVDAGAPRALDAERGDASVGPRRRNPIAGGDGPAAAGCAEHRDRRGCRRGRRARSSASASTRICTTRDSSR